MRGAVLEGMRVARNGALTAVYMSRQASTTVVL